MRDSSVLAGLVSCPLSNCKNLLRFHTEFARFNHLPEERIDVSRTVEVFIEFFKGGQHKVPPCKFKDFKGAGDAESSSETVPYDQIDGFCAGRCLAPR